MLIVQLSRHGSRSRKKEGKMGGIEETERGRGGEGITRTSPGDSINKQLHASTHSLPRLINLSSSSDMSDSTKRQM